MAFSRPKAAFSAFACVTKLSMRCGEAVRQRQSPARYSTRRKTRNVPQFPRTSTQEPGGRPGRSPSRLRKRHGRNATLLGTHRRRRWRWGEATQPPNYDSDDQQPCKDAEYDAHDGASGEVLPVRLSGELCLARLRQRRIRRLRDRALGRDAPAATRQDKRRA